MAAGLALRKCAPLSVRETGTQRGKGLFANQNLPRNQFICEYTSAPPFPISKRKEVEAEHAANGMGCYILEAKEPISSRTYCFDATYRFNSFGRYINHAPKQYANVKPLPPMNIRGRLRVGFIATRDISCGEELFWDYNLSVKDAAWSRDRPERE